MTLEELTIAILEGRIPKRTDTARKVTLAANFQPSIIGPFLTDLIGPYYFATDEKLPDGQIELSEAPK